MRNSIKGFIEMDNMVERWKDFVKRSYVKKG